MFDVGERAGWRVDVRPHAALGVGSPCSQTPRVGLPCTQTPKPHILNPAFKGEDWLKWKESRLKGGGWYMFAGLD